METGQLEVWRIKSRVEEDHSTAGHAGPQSYCKCLSVVFRSSSNIQSRKRKNLIRKRSRDNEKLTDEQQVARAEARARYPPLMVKDLFSVFGIYHNFFWLSILLNSLMWSMGAVHYDMVRVLTLRREDYEATDAEKMVYKPHRDFEPFVSLFYRNQAYMVAFSTFHRRSSISSTNPRRLQR